MAAGWDDLDAFLVRQGVRINQPSLGATTGGGHITGSLHYAGVGRDYGRGSDHDAIVAALLPYAQGPNYTVQELFYRDTLWAKGVQLTPANSKSYARIRRDHQGHVHAALRPGLPRFPPDQGATPVAAGQLPGADALNPGGAFLGGLATGQVKGLDVLDTLTGGAASQIAGLMPRLLQIAGGGLLVAAGVLILTRDAWAPAARVAAAVAP